MSANKLSDITKIGHDVLSTTQSQTTGLVTAQLGDVVTEDATSHDAEWYFPPGLVSRPRKPDPKKKAAQVVAITRSGNDAIVGCRDERTLDIYGQLDDGETAVFGSAPDSAVVFFRKDKSLLIKQKETQIQITADGVINLGNDPVALALGSALGQLISIMTTFCGGNATALGSPLSTSAAAITALQALTDYQTTDTNGT